MADDLDQGYIQTRQQMRAFQSRMLMEPTQEGNVVHMGVQAGGTPQEGATAGPQGTATTPQPDPLAPATPGISAQPSGAPRPDITVDTPDMAAVRQQGKEQVKPYVFDLDTFDVPGDVVRAGLAKLSGVDRGDKEGTLRMSSDEMVNKVFFQYGDKPEEVIKQAEALGLPEADTLKIMSGLSAVVLGMVTDPLNFIPGGAVKGQTQVARAAMPAMESEVAALAASRATPATTKKAKTYRTIKPEVIEKASRTLDQLIADEQANIAATRKAGASPEELDASFENLHYLRERKTSLATIHDMDEETLRLMIENVDNDLKHFKGRTTEAAETVDDELEKEGSELIAREQLFGEKPQMIGITKRDVAGASEAFRISHQIEGLKAERAVYAAALRDSVQGRVFSEFKRAAKILKDQRGSVPLGGAGKQLPPEMMPRSTDGPSPLDNVILYHGANAEGTRAIEEAGSVGGHSQAIFFSSKIGAAEAYAKAQGGKVFSIRASDLPKVMLDQLEAEGDDISKMYELSLPSWGPWRDVRIPTREGKLSGGGIGKPPTITPPGAAAEEPLSPKALATIAKREESKQNYGFAVEGFMAELTKQRRGPVLADEAVRRLAGESGFTLQDLLDLKPGTVLAPEIQLAAREVYDKAADRLRDSAKTYLEVADDEALADFFEAFSQAGIATTRIIGTYSEAGRTFRGLNQKYPTLKTGVTPQSKDPEFSIQDVYIQQMYQFFRGMEEKSKMGGFARPRGSGVEQDMVTPGHLAEMVSKLKSREELMAFARAATKPTWSDMLYEIWVNGLLSGPITHSTNIISNAATLLWNIPERQLASLIKPGSVRPGEAAAMIGGVTESIGDAWRMAWKAFKDDAPQFGQSKLETPRRAITADALELTGATGAAVDFLGNAVRLPGRFLMAGDDFFKAIAFRAELRALAKRQAFREINELGLTGKEAARKAQEIEGKILADPPESIKEAAQEFAAYTTFTRELGEAGSAAQMAVQKIPIMRVVVPFIRTPTNIFKFAAERSPVAALARVPGIRRLPGFRAIAEEFAAGGERRALAQAKIGLSAMTMGYIAMLAANGQITGGGPKDKALRKLWIDAGNQPYSIKVGKEWVSYGRIEPIGSIIGLAADITDIIGQLPQSKGDELAASLVVAMSRNVAQKTFVKGLAGTLNAATSQDINVVRGFLEKEVGTLMPYSSALRQTARTVDPTLREVNSLWEAWAKTIPGYSEDLPPMRNLFGEPILLGGGLGPDLISPLYTNTPKEDPVRDELVRLGNAGAVVSNPSPYVEGININKEPLGPKVYDRYQELAGTKPKDLSKTLHEQLAETMKSSLYRNAPDDGKQTLIRADLDMYRNFAKLQMEVEDKEFAKAMQLQRMRAATKFDANARQKQGAAPTLR